MITCPACGESLQPSARRLGLFVASAHPVIAEDRGDLEPAVAEYRERAPQWVDQGFPLEEARVLEVVDVA